MSEGSARMHSCSVRSGCTGRWDASGGQCGWVAGWAQEERGKQAGGMPAAPPCGTCSDRQASALPEWAYRGRQPLLNASRHRRPSHSQHRGQRCLLPTHRQVVLASGGPLCGLDLAAERRRARRLLELGVVGGCCARRRQVAVEVHPPHQVLHPWVARRKGDVIELRLATGRVVTGGGRVGARRRGRGAAGRRGGGGGAGGDSGIARARPRGCRKLDAVHAPRPYTA